MDKKTDNQLVKTKAYPYTNKRMVQTKENNMVTLEEQYKILYDKSALLLEIATKQVYDAHKEKLMLLEDNRTLKDINKRMENCDNCESKIGCNNVECRDAVDFPLWKLGVIK